MNTDQITTDTYTMADLDDLALIDGYWDSDKILAIISVAGRRVYVAKQGLGNINIGYMIVEPIGSWLTIQRMQVLASDKAVQLLFTRAKLAMDAINFERARRRETDRLTGVMMVVDAKESGAFESLRANGFRIHRGERLPPEDDGTEWIAMTWERGT